MLVFTRRRQETIMIGDGIEVRVLRVGRDGVRLGIVAPASVPVHRLEVYSQIRQVNQSAATAAAVGPSLAARIRKKTGESGAPDQTTGESGAPDETAGESGVPDQTQ
jgi:carbon storage regulator